MQGVAECSQISQWWVFWTFIARETASRKAATLQKYWGSGWIQNFKLPVHCCRERREGWFNPWLMGFIKETFFSLHGINNSHTQILHLVLVFTSLKGLLKTCRRYRKSYKNLVVKKFLVVIKCGKGGGGYEQLALFFFSALVLFVIIGSLSR